MAEAFCEAREWLLPECKCAGEACDCGGTRVLLVPPWRAGEALVRGGVVIVGRIA